MTSPGRVPPISQGTPGRLGKPGTACLAWLALSCAWILLGRLFPSLIPPWEASRIAAGGVLLSLLGCGVASGSTAASTIAPASGNGAIFGPGTAALAWLRQFLTGAFCAILAVSAVVVVSWLTFAVSPGADKTYFIILAALTFGNAFVLGTALPAGTKPSGVRLAKPLAVFLLFGLSGAFLPASAASGTFSSLAAGFAPGCMLDRLQLTFLETHGPVLEREFVAAFAVGPLLALLLWVFLATRDGGRQPAGASRRSALTALALVPLAALGFLNLASADGGRDHRAVARQVARNRVKVFQNVRVGQGSRSDRELATIVVRGGKIVLVSEDPVDPGAFPGAEIFPGEGRTLVPGLIDTLTFPAAFARQSETEPEKIDGRVRDFMRRTALAGITSIQVADLPVELAGQVAAAIRGGFLFGPEIRTAATGGNRVFTEGSGFLGPSSGASEPSADSLLLQVPAAPRKPFLAMLQVQARRAEADGQPIVALLESWLQLPEALQLGARQVFLPPVMDSTPPATLAELQSRGVYVSLPAALSESPKESRQALHVLYSSGLRLIPGSHSGIGETGPGTTFHRELGAWAESGIPAAAILEAATTAASTAIGLSARTGMIEPGFDADLILVEGNPLEDIGALSKIVAIVLKGEVIDPADPLK